MLFYVWEGAPEDTKKEIIESLSKIQYEFTKLDTRIASNKFSNTADKFDRNENNANEQDIVNVKLSDITILKRLDVQSQIDSLEIFSILINRGNCEVYLPENVAKEISKEINFLPEKLSEYNKIGYKILINQITDGIPIKNYGQTIKYGEIMQFITKENCDILSIQLNTSSGNFVINKNRIELIKRNTKRNNQKYNDTSNTSNNINPSENTDQSDNNDQSE